MGQIFDPSSFYSHPPGFGSVMTVLTYSVPNNPLSFPETPAETGKTVPSVVPGVSRGILPGADMASQKKPGLTEPVTDTLSLTGDYSMATPYSIRVPLEPGVLKKGGNRICISVM